MQDTSHLHIEFFVQTQEDAKATREAGFPKFKDVEMVRVRFVGDRNQELVAPADDVTFCPEQRIQLTYKDQFPRHYAAFKENRGNLVDGTPLEELPGITGSKVAEFKAQKVFTIESLAQLDGTQLNRLGMHAREWKNRATKWLSDAKEGAIDAKLAAQNADLQEQLKAMAAQIALLSGNGAPVVEDKTPKIEVVQTGHFAGHTADDLKRFIQTKTGTGVKGRPSLNTLMTMAEDLVAKEELSA